MRKIALITALAFAALPAGALAAKPSHPSTPASTNANSKANGTSTTGTSSSASANGGAVKVLFVLRGSITGYTAGATVSIKVAGSNHESSLLKGQTLVFPLNSSTKIVNTVTVTDQGIVKVRAAKNASVATLQTGTATQVIDQGASS